MSQYLQQISSYFRQSCIDSERMCPEDKELKPVLGGKEQNLKGDYLALPAETWKLGRIASDLAEQILDARQSKDQPELQSLQILIFPRVDLQKCNGGINDKRKNIVLLPLVVFANLQRDGSLTPAGTAPWIPRIWVGPNQSANEPFTEIVLLDEFFTLHPFEGVDTWQLLTDYCARLLCYATGTQYQERKAHQPGTDIYDISISEEYTRSNECILQLKSEIVGAKANIIKLLDYLLTTKKYPKLYKTFTNRRDIPLKSYDEKRSNGTLASKHLGQMSGEFPLSPKQRNTLHYFLEQKAGQILAVNGPPGTGKTTLLRSVVANMWTKAALAKEDPPIIVATSNNNQAVTNILESFARIDEEDLEDSLKGRWIEEVDSYGLFFCSSSRVKSNPFRYSAPNGDGCMAKWQSPDFIERAIPFFLQKTTLWLGEECKSLEDASIALHRAMKQLEVQVKTGNSILGEYQLSLLNISNKFGSVDALSNEIQLINKAISELEVDFQNEKSLLDEILGLWEARSWWVRLLLWLPLIKTQEARKTARILNRWDRHFAINYDGEVESAINQQMALLREKISFFQRQKDELESLLNHHIAIENKLDSWFKPADSMKIFSASLSDKVEEVNDRYYRFKLFKLATHYYESQWLIETKAFAESKDEDKRSSIKLLRKFRRYAKLTPCFVSTFYMVPSTFQAKVYQDKVWMDVPMLEEIDLLIVDEAGQALPEVSAASFALAKKALIVGDTDQIEPVWSIPASVDRSNLKLFGLLKDEVDYQRWLESGLLASSGNVMRVAQRQCQYHQFENLQRGLYLTEHRRCFNSIISYCNELVYEGALEPCRGEPNHVVPWGTMSMVSVSSVSQSFGGSKGNLGEAEVIAQWLYSQLAEIVSYAREQDVKYREMTDTDVLCKVVGVVTPFSKQAKLIRSELKKVGIHGVTVGTVHSLQGDERLVVLFSSVYGGNNRDGGKFYDAGPNMLNVAVSRAKNAFIVFGDVTVFGVTSQGSPSAKLRQRLTVRTDSEKAC